MRGALQEGRLARAKACSQRQCVAFEEEEAVPSGGMIMSSETREAKGSSAPQNFQGHVQICGLYPSSPGKKSLQRILSGRWVRKG